MFHCPCLGRRLQIVPIRILIAIRREILDVERAELYCLPRTPEATDTLLAMLAEESRLALELWRGRGSNGSEGVLLLKLVWRRDGPLQVCVCREDDLRSCRGVNGAVTSEHARPEGG